MLSLTRKYLCFALALSFVFLPALRAQQTVPKAAPIPSQIASAHTVFVSNGGGSNYFNQFTGGPDRAYNTLYAYLQQSGHYQLVSSPSQADLIFEIRSIAPAVDDGNNGVAYNPQLVLSIQDPQTKAVLWTTNANVRAIGRQVARDRGFDKSVAVVVDKMAQVTGQPLTASQLKAIDSNSKWPTSLKLILILGIAASIGLTAFGLYKVSHPPTLTPPMLPAFP